MSGRDPSGSGPWVWDEGLQGERTSLAWERTALALAANGALLLRAGVVDGVLLARALGGVVLGVAAVMLVASRTRYVRRDAALRGEGPEPGDRLLLVVGGAAVTVSVGILATVVTLAIT